MANAKLMRLCVSLALIIAPLFLLLKGIYGSFLFTFIVPFLWEYGLKGRKSNFFGIRAQPSPMSALAGIASGLFLGIAGGRLIALLGQSGKILTGFDALQLSLGPFRFSFPLNGELGYRLLSESNSVKGTFFYFIFSIVLIGLGEELFWRGFILKKLALRLHTHAAVWFTAFLFALIHFYIFTFLPVMPALYFLALIAIAGAVWGYLFIFSGTLWPSAVSHGITAFIVWKYYFFGTVR